MYKYPEEIEKRRRVLGERIRFTQHPEQLRVVQRLKSGRVESETLSVESDGARVCGVRTRGARE